jgi:hypothetical protein
MLLLGQRAHEPDLHSPQFRLLLAAPHLFFYSTPAHLYLHTHDKMASCELQRHLSCSLILTTPAMQDAGFKRKLAPTEPPKVSCK